MPEPLKYLYNDEFFTTLTKVVQRVKPDFSRDQFLRDIYADKWEEKELKERMRHIAVTLQRYLSEDFEQAARMIVAMVGLLKSASEEMSFVYMFFPDYMEVFGLDDFETSVKAMEAITQFTSCEFAVRPFLIRYPQKMLTQMKHWSKHPNAMVRRLATEGCRPRLPWAMALPAYKKNPEPILPILEHLKNDPSESVRRSVANNLNDISKDHPALAIALAKSWKGKNKETDWVVRHACRGLLKAGYPEVMSMFGFGDTGQINVSDLKVLTPIVEVGEYLQFSFCVHNRANKTVRLRLEYGIYFQKANASLVRKVFMISEREYAANEKNTIVRKQSFRVITTRKLYPGLHQVSVIINGKEFAKQDFELIS